MAQPIIQASFNAGEWSPTLNARVDLTKYKSGAALLENWFVDYRGGASTRPGTRYILRAKDSTQAVRMIPFQATFDVGYGLEFGHRYIRFYQGGEPVLEDSFAITAATSTDPCVLTITGNNYSVGDWIFISGVGGMTQLNGRYFIITVVLGAAITIANLSGDAINSSAYGTYTSGGLARRVYTLISPYDADDLALLKYAQEVGQLTISHNDYTSRELTFVEPDNWTLLPASIGTTAPTPLSPTASTTLAAGDVHYSYVVTSVDASGQESVASAVAILTDKEDIRTVAGTNHIGWAAAPGATSYNVYRADVSYFGAIPAGTIHGFIGNTNAITFDDSNIGPDFSRTPPIAENPFVGSGVAMITVSTPSTYTAVPAVSFTGGTPLTNAAARAVLRVQSATAPGSGTGYAAGDVIYFPNNVALVVNSQIGGVPQTYKAMTDPLANRGVLYTGSTPTNPVASIATSGIGTGATATLTWGVGVVEILNSGSGYTVAPTVVFSPAGAVATSTLLPESNANPGVPGYAQQRRIFGGSRGAPQTFFASQPGAPSNFNVSFPTQASDAISGELVSGQLNTIKAFVPQTSGLVIFTDQASWLVNGGQPGAAFTPFDLSANIQSYSGISDVPPLVVNADIIYVQAKGSVVRNASYNFYANVFTGADISVLSAHLFYGYNVTEWCWAEEPFKLVWAVRDDGALLSLTYVKEQEFIAWAHSVTEGYFRSTCSVVGVQGANVVDEIYLVCERTLAGNQVKYIEIFQPRVFPDGVIDAWCVDSGLGYEGVAETDFTGGEHLAGMTIHGLADGEIIPPFVMPSSGEFTLATAAEKVTVGLGYTCDLQTLAIDTGDPTIQGEVKAIPSVTVRVADTLGLTIGSSFGRLVSMKDLVRGNVSSTLVGQDSQVITDLVTGDAKTVIDATYTVPGQYCIRQTNPYPATVLGVIPHLQIAQKREAR